MASQPNDDFDFEVEEEFAEGGMPEVEVQDDTPEADRGREPMPKDIVEELENDELEEYSEKVKTRLKQMKKVWHDERREKERFQRENAEAIEAARRYKAEVDRLRGTLTEGEGHLINSYKQSAEYEAREAERAYREAYEAGDTDKLIEAQRKMNETSYKLQQLNNYQPARQPINNEVEVQHERAPVPQVDAKTSAWQERNGWYGTDAEMTASALGLHQKLLNERGPQYAGTDEYWQTIDTTMRRRFPEYFGDEVASGDKPSARDTKAAPVVAPASRSRSPRKIVLKQSQLAIAKRLGLTPEQYARELMKSEN